jgi:hypothetical protein
MSEVKIVVLKTGEQLLSRIEETIDSITMEKPVMMFPLPGNKISFRDWIVGAKISSVTIKKENVNVVVEASKEIEDIYVSSTSKIQAPPPGAKMAILGNK